MAKIFVTAALGRVVPLHANDAQGPGATNIMLRPTDAPLCVEKTAAIERRLRAGDLIEVAPPTDPKE